MEIKEMTSFQIRGAMDSLHDGVPVLIDHCPGNGSRYEIVLSPIGHASFNVNGAWPEGIAKDGFPVLVSIPNHGTCYWFDFRWSDFHVSYVAEKLCRGNLMDGMSVADLLNKVTAT